MKHIFTLLLLASAFTGVQAQTEGVQVSPENTLAIPVDNLDICPWMADFTVSFTIDCDAIQPDTLTSLLSLRSREWDGTDKEYRGTLWVEYDGKTGMLSFNRRYFEGVIECNAEIELEGRHTISIVHSSPSKAYVTQVSDIYDKNISIYVDDQRLFYDPIDYGIHENEDLWWRETSYFLIGDEVADAMSYNGTVYDFKYYDRPLTESEIKEYWNASYNEGGELPEHLKLYVNAENGNLNSSNSSVLPLLADYRSDAFKPEEHTRPDTYLPVLSRDSVNYIHYIEFGCDYSRSNIFEVRASSENDTVWYQVNGMYGELYMPEDNSVIYYGRNGERKGEIYNMNLEVGDEVLYDNIDFYPPVLEVVDTYYADGRKNIVFNSGRKFMDFADAESLQEKNPGLFPAGSEYYAYLYQNYRLIEGVFPLPVHAEAFLRGMKYGSEIAWLNPVFDIYSLEVRGGTTSVETISSGKAPYSLFSTVVGDRLVINGSGISSVSVASPAGAVMPCVLAGDNTVDVSALARGIYMLRVCGTEGVQTLKFVKE